VKIDLIGAEKEIKTKSKVLNSKSNLALLISYKNIS
jgi:hypothetical protein